jgi:hypothetical protein
MFSIKTPTFLLLFFVFSFNTFAQKPAPIEFGKIPMEDLQMKVYAKDSSAEAVVLCDYGEYSYSFGDYPSVIYRHHIRIKILKKTGFDKANIRILYREGNDNRHERIRNLKATTYNLENGNMATYTLDEKSIFDDKANKTVHFQTFTLPQIREGSVIEYSYELESGIWYDLRNWEFQKDIPVVWSELRAKIPGYFDFNMTFQSQIPLSINENSQGKQFFMRGSIEDPFLEYRFVMKDIPAIKVEPFVTTIENFRSKLAFELAATYFPDQIKRDYSQTWEALNQTLLENESFGKQIKKFDAAEGIAKLLKAQSYHYDTLSIAKAAFKHIQNTMQWNDEERAFTGDVNLDKVYEKRLGNSAEINLMLVRLLRECGVEANPFILSTRANGRVSDLVLLDRFNYTIAHIVLGGKDVFLDASSSLMPFGMLPTRCLNERGRLVIRKNSRWITINPEPVRKKITMINMEITPDQSSKAQVKFHTLGIMPLILEQPLLRKGKIHICLIIRKIDPTKPLNLSKLSTLIP